MNDKGGSLKGKNPELFSTSPKKSNSLGYLKSEPYKRANFHWYSNPVIGHKHILEPSKKSGSPTPKKSWGKTIGARGSYPE